MCFDEYLIFLQFIYLVDIYLIIFPIWVDVLQQSLALFHDLFVFVSEHFLAVFEIDPVHEIVWWAIDNLLKSLYTYLFQNLDGKEHLWQEFRLIKWKDRFLEFVHCSRYTFLSKLKLTISKLYFSLINCRINHTFYEQFVNHRLLREQRLSKTLLSQILSMGSRQRSQKVAFGLWSLRMVVVPEDYYAQPLEYRRDCLSAPHIDYLWKTIVFENTAYNEKFNVFSLLI